jgi:hypothetical protein
MSIRTVYIAKYLAPLLFMGLVNPAAGQQHGWPIMPGTEEKPIANNMGDFWVYEDGKPYQHPGLDILATPHTEPNAPYAIVTVGGTIHHVNKDDQTGRRNEVQIDGDDGTRYVYGHLAYGTFVGKFLLDRPKGQRVEAGFEIAKIYDWNCDYSHLHYELQDFQGNFSGSAVRYLNPLTDMQPNADAFPPQVEEIHFADRQPPRWSEFAPPSVTTLIPPPTCAVVKGEVDIVAKLVDRDETSASTTNLNAGNVGVYDLRWRVCPKSTPACTAWNDTHKFDDMPLTWIDGGNADTFRQFSATPFMVTTADQCSPTVNDTYRIATDKTAAAWITSAQPDGSYSVSIEATDKVGNKTTRTALACVQNNPSACTTDLMIRDGADDNGGTPYFGFPFFESPDITVNSATPFEGTVRETRNNTVEVTVRNTGSCRIPAGSTYQVCLGWSLPSPYIPFPLAAGQTLPCKNETVTSSGWAPGEARPTTFNWMPASGSVPLGHACLVAWSNVTGDPVQPTSSVILDNNRAQKNIAILKPPSLFEGFAQTFYVHHADAMPDRSMEVTLRTSEGQPYKGEVRLHVPPTVKVGRVTGASLVDTYKQVRRRELCSTDDPRCRTECPDPDNAARIGCAAVYGSVDDPQHRLKLEGISVDDTSPLLIEIKGDDGLPPGGFIEARIVEFSTADRQPDSAIGGLTLRFQIPARP